MSTVLTNAGASGPSPSTGYGAISLGSGVLEKDQVTTEISEDVPPLGVPHAEKRFWFQRAKTYDPDAIATLVRR